ncbi:hypothetical protein QOZ80_5BG0426370 [Eleusine coracana subsp. coracana]|nr:hypothetical protein QOZ80_5BG0426370 [Eleusine coracana subsp. coracana]
MAAGSSNSNSAADPPAPALISSHPSPVEVIKILRAHVISGSATPAVVNNLPIIHIADVYAEDPADLTRRSQGTVAENGEVAWYYLSRLQPKSQRGGGPGKKRKQRSTEHGEWKGEGKRKDICAASEGNRVIGKSNLFAFRSTRAEDGKKQRTGWNLHEFRLGEEEESLVLCKVSRSPRAPNLVVAMANESVAAPPREDADGEAAADLEAREASMKHREESMNHREAEMKQSEESMKQREAAVKQAELNLAIAYESTAVKQAELEHKEAELKKREAAPRLATANAVDIEGSRAHSIMDVYPKENEATTKDLVGNMDAPMATDLEPDTCAADTEVGYTDYFKEEWVVDNGRIWRRLGDIPSQLSIFK